MRAAALILVRHAAPTIEPDSPAPAWRLSYAGRRAAFARAGRLAGFAPTSVVASPEPKALETAQILAAPLGLAVTEDEGLAEHHRPDLPFGSREAFEARMATFFAEPASPFFGGESADQAQARNTATHERHAAQPHKDASHGTGISLYLARRLGLEPLALWKSLALPEAFVLAADGRLLARVG